MNAIWLTKSIYLLAFAVLFFGILFFNRDRVPCWWKRLLMAVVGVWVLLFVGPLLSGLLLPFVLLILLPLEFVLPGLVDVNLEGLCLLLLANAYAFFLYWRQRVNRRNQSGEAAR